MSLSSIICSASKQAATRSSNIQHQVSPPTALLELAVTPCPALLPGTSTPSSSQTLRPCPLSTPASQWTWWSSGLPLRRLCRRWGAWCACGTSLKMQCRSCAAAACCTAAQLLQRSSEHCAWQLLCGEADVNIADAWQSNAVVACDVTSSMHPSMCMSFSMPGTAPGGHLAAIAAAAAAAAVATDAVMYRQTSILPLSTQC
jgi:hypothetical protein